MEKGECTHVACRYRAVTHGSVEIVQVLGLQSNGNSFLSVFLSLYSVLTLITVLAQSANMHMFEQSFKFR